MKDPETATSKSPAKSRRFILVASAAAIAAAAFAFSSGIYGGKTGSGNGTTPDSASVLALKTAVSPLLTGQIAAMAIREPSDDLSTLTFNNDAGEAITMADTGGKIRLVNIWATWCAPCREEMPSLDALQKELGSDDFEVVAISVDNGSEEKPRAFFKEIGLSSLGFYHDPTLGVFNTLKKQNLALGLPVTLLLDADNRVIANMNGPAHWASDDAKTMIRTAVAESKK